jgi:hypothetical protein
LQLLQVLFQVLGDPTLANSLSQSLIDLALTVESSDIRKKIFERVLPMKTPAAKAFIEELVSFQGTAKSRRDWARPSALPLIASGDLVTSALMQLFYHSPIFRNAVFRSHSDHPFVECLRWCYARMQTGKRTSVDVTGEFPDISIYAEHFPDVVAIVDQTETINLAEFDAPVLMIKSNDPGPEIVGDSHTKIGLIRRSLEQNPAVHLIGRSASYLIQGDVCYEMNETAISGLIAGQNATSWVICYERAGEKPTLELPADLAKRVRADNKRIRKEDLFFSPDMFEHVMGIADGPQWLAYFLNIVCQTSFDGELMSIIEQRNQTLEVHMADLLPYLARIQTSVKRQERRKSFFSFLSSVITADSPEDLFPLVEVLIEHLNTSVLPLLEIYCQKGPAAIHFCNLHSLGQKLVSFVTQQSTTFPHCVSLFRALMHFPIPELAEIRSYAFEHTFMPPDLTVAVMEVLSLACIYGFVSSDELPRDKIGDRLMAVMTRLLHSFAFDAVLEYAERDRAMLDVALALKSSFTKFSPFLFDHPSVIVRLLADSEANTVALGLLQELHLKMTPEIRDRFVAGIIESLSNDPPLSPILSALHELEFKGGPTIWSLIPRLGDDSKDMFFKLIGSLDVDEVRPHFAELLPLLKENIPGRLSFILKAFDDSLSSLESWPEILTLLSGSDGPIIEQLVLQIWPFPSFRPFVEQLLIRPERTVTKAVLEIVESFAISESTLKFFLHFVEGFLESNDAEGVTRLSRKILQECSQFDLSTVELDVVHVFAFLQNGFHKELFDLLKFICSQNDEFDSIISDEVATFARRRADAPHLVMLDMVLHAKSLADVVRFYRSACDRLPDCTRTSGFLFEYFDKVALPAVELAIRTWSVSPVASKAEKTILRSGVEALDRTRFLALVSDWAKKINSAHPKPADMRKLHLLIKWRSRDRDDILRLAGIGRDRGLALSLSSEEMKKYTGKVFGISQEELNRTPRPGQGRSPGRT